MGSAPLCALQSHGGPRAAVSTADAGPTRGWVEVSQEAAEAGWWGQDGSQLARGVRPNSTLMLLNQQRRGNPAPPGGIY